MSLAQSTPSFEILTLVGGWVVLVFVAALGSVVVWSMFTGTIDLTKLISEPTGDASMSRFQLLIFTFVIATSLFLITVYNRGFPAIIPQGILVLLGISSSSYLVSKGIQFSSAAGVSEADPSVVITPQRVTVPAGGAPFTFQATTTNLGEGAAVKWTLPPGSNALGSINADTGVYTPPPAPAPPCPYVEIHATSVDKPSVFDLALVHLT